jgi:hypothetical protein
MEFMEHLNVKVLVRCKSGYAMNNIFYISQIGAPFLDECPGGDLFRTMEEMMPSMWNVCTQVLCHCKLAAKCIEYDWKFESIASGGERLRQSTTFSLTSMDCEIY